MARNVAFKESVAEDPIRREVADYVDWIDHLHEGVETHASFSKADPSDHRLRVSLKLWIVHDGRGDEDETEY